MKRTPAFMLEEAAEVKRVIRENPWVTIASPVEGSVVASHYPALLEETGDESISLITHVGRPDEELHRLGSREVLVIVQGPHGYVSPSWYPSGSFIPTWNHVTAHLYGTPVVLSAEENLRALGDLVDHFESRVDAPRSLSIDIEFAARMARGTAGFRIPIDRVDARLKLSQNKSTADIRGVIAGLESDGAYSNARLASEMRRIEATRAGEQAD
ncbi:FMN-binding negative transcriptional regulator [Microbacterium sp. ET2]|uniref:FMN-binding negative transcriptional regulator n=1 Tax=Microbacterium albipurpureum TaxID=3050384 RepID=UPI00259CD097|nr:FMN-binding negative transcriptional regulator [Microbacterium sp. ET2 (Ac-2212)]WJL96668.1 FMN-binding negative transcriptional regulator [Microbacterium sp. ET2 (Ac-2212)]